VEQHNPQRSTTGTAVPGGTARRAQWHCRATQHGKTVLVSTVVLPGMAWPSQFSGWPV